MVFKHSTLSPFKFLRDFSIGELVYNLKETKMERRRALVAFTPIFWLFAVVQLDSGLWIFQWQP